MEFGEKLQNLRKSRGYTQEQLAEAADISRQTLSKWELGTAKPDADNIVVISRIFGVSTDYLLIDDYDSDEDIPAVQQNSRKISVHYKNRMRITVGAIITVICIAGLLIIGIMAGVNPATHTEISVPEDGTASSHTSYGIIGFTAFFGIQWLFILCIIGAVVGIALIISSLISQKSRKRK